MAENFIPQKGYYRKLRVYQVAEIIYDVTFRGCLKTIVN